MGIAALILGIVSIVLCVIPSFAVTQGIGGFVALVAIVLGILGRRRVIYDGNKGIATAGMVLGIVAFVFNSAVFASCMVCQARFGDKVDEVRTELKRAVDEGRRRKQQETDDARPGNRFDSAQPTPEAPAPR